MKITLISDTITTIATNYTHTLGLTFSNLPNSDQNHQITAVMFPIDAIAPPIVKPRTSAPPKKLARKRCRVKRSSKTDSGGGGAYSDEDGGGFFDGGDGPFGGGGGNGGGGDGFNWDESVSPSDPAFDFVYGVLCWIVFSNCLHFAFKKVIRILTDSDRDKVPMC